MDLPKSSLSIAIMSLLLSLATSTLAAPLANVKLTIKPGVSDGTTCLSGSCFGTEVSPGFFIWQSIAPGTDGDIILGKNQRSGGQELGSITTPGELTAAWSWFRVYGTFATAPLLRNDGTLITDDASLNKFDSASCAGAACLGKTKLGTWNIAWNGSAVRGGSASPCTNARCTPDQQAGIDITNWTVNSDKSYSLDYSWFPPDNSGSDVVLLGNFYLHLEGQIVPQPAVSGTWLSTETWPSPSPDGSNPILFIFGDNLTPVLQLTINGTIVTSIQPVGARLLLVLLPLPSDLTLPFTVCVTTANGTSCFPRPCQ